MNMNYTSEETFQKIDKLIAEETNKEKIDALKLVFWLLDCNNSMIDIQESIEKYAKNRSSFKVLPYVMDKIGKELRYDTNSQNILEQANKKAIETYNKVISDRISNNEQNINYFLKSWNIEL